MWVMEKLTTAQTTTQERDMQPSEALIAPIRNRRSIRAFSDRPVEDDTIAQLLEAARWSASCFNEQPWRFLVVRKENAADFELMASCINDNNRPWAQEAPLLLLAVAKDQFSAFDHPNPYAWHDVGLAMGNLSIQATSLGLNLHQMAGILPDRIRDIFELPELFSPVSITAIGYPGNSADLPEPFRSKDAQPRERKPVAAYSSIAEWRAALD